MALKCPVSLFPTFFKSVISIENSVLLSQNKIASHRDGLLRDANLLPSWDSILHVPSPRWVLISSISQIF